MGGIPLNKIKHKYYTGTTSATADEAPTAKKLVPPEWIGKTLTGILNGDGCYAYGADYSRGGIHVPNTEVAFEAGSTDYIDVVMLTDVLGVCVFVDAGDSNKGKVRAFTVDAGGTLTYGTVATLNNAGTTFTSICKVDSTTFAVAYVDDGGDDYLGAKIGTVSGTTITLGDETLLLSASVKVSNSGLGIAIPRPGVLAVGYALAGDTYGYVVGATFSGTTIAAAGTAVKFSGTDAATYIDMCSHANGYVAVAYNGASNYCTINVGTVSAAAVVVFGGSAEAMNAAASTSIEIHSPSTNKLVCSWIEAGDATIIAGTVSTTTVTQGTATSVTGTHLTASTAMFSDTEGILVYEDDAHAGDYGACQHFSIDWSDKSVTVDTIVDYFAEASTQTTVVAANARNEAVVLYDDAGASNAGNSQYLLWKEDGLIDIRSDATSTTYTLYLLPLDETVVN